jgi:hypothetical protein
MGAGVIARDQPMDQLTKRIAKLARLVAEARDLSEVETYFHDEVVPHPSFISEGAPALHKPLRDIVRNVARAYGCLLPNEYSLLHLPRFSLWHGWLGSPSASMALLIYFDDQHRGVASFGKFSDRYTRRIRFSLPEGARDPDVELGNMKIASASPANGRGLA